jgi:hypothetical protein
MGGFLNRVGMQACDAESESAASHSIFKCKGIFSVTVHKDVDALKNSINLPKALQLIGRGGSSPATYLSCEGSATSFTKVAEHNDDGHGDEDKMKLDMFTLHKSNAQETLQSQFKSGGTLGVVQHQMCSGTFRLLTIGLPFFNTPTSVL